MKKPGRPLEYDLDEVLEIAMHLFWRKGYEATSLNDLLQATNMTKSSFYYAFETKYALFERCVARYRDRQVAQLLLELRQAATGRNFIEAFFNSLVDTIEAPEQVNGCLVINAANEFACRTRADSSLILNATVRLTEVFQSAILRGQEEGVIPAHKDPVALAYFLMSNVAGIRTMINAKVDPAKIKAIVAIALTALD